MKKIYTLLTAVILTASTFAQAPEKMSYQAVVRDAANALVSTQTVGMQISILQGSITGSTVYVETQTPTTNINGLVSIEIGIGTVVSGTFNTIDWSAGPYFIQTETDPTGGTTYTITGTSQLMSVPYALHANTAENVMNDLVDDADADPTNEMNTGVVLNGTDLEVSDGNGTIVTDLSSLQDGVNDADADPTNEMNTGVVLNGTDLEVTDGNGTIVTDLSSLQDGVNDADSDPNNEMQAVSFSNDTLYLSNGGQVYLGTYGIDLVDDADNDPTNEYNTSAQINGNDLEITDGGGTIAADISSLATEVEVSAALAAISETDPVFMSSAASGINSSDIVNWDATYNDVNSNSADWNNAYSWGNHSTMGYMTTEVDGSTTNELQTISRTGTTVTLSNGGGTFQDSVGVYTAGTGISITGAGTSVSPYVVSTVGCTYSVGDLVPALGGYIFYLDGSGCHGLVAKATDEAGTYQWSSTNFTTWAYASGIYGGAQNTKKSISRAVANSSTCAAASVCDNLASGGYTDWYLPSKDELDMMYVNLHLQGLGGFASVYYWSSTEGDGHSAWGQDFSYGGAQGANYGKNGNGAVRAVRAF